jgi:hypothetical protein
MLNLATSTDKLQMITSAVGDVDAHASWVDDVSDVFTAGKTNTTVTTAATTDIVAAPGAGVRNVKFLSIRNTHATVGNDITILYNANGTIYELFKATLLAGEELVCREGVWFHFNVSGGVYSATAAQPVDVQVFTTTGANTWTKPTSFTPKVVMVKLWGAGGGGGAGGSVGAVIGKGGGGGGGGAFVRESYAAADLGATVTVTVGAGGTAGVPGAAGAVGGAGSAGGNTSFGASAVAYGGGGGAGGAIYRRGHRWRWWRGHRRRRRVWRDDDARHWWCPHGDSRERRRRWPGRHRHGRGHGDSERGIRRRGRCRHRRDTDGRE